MTDFKSVAKNALAALGFTLFVLDTISPRFHDRLFSALMFDGTIEVDAHIDACEPLRNGGLRESVVRCAFSYAHRGQTYRAVATAWSSRSPFLTSAALDRVLAEQLADPLRRARLSPEHPDDASLVEQRWLAMPSLGTWLTVAFVALAWLVVWLEGALRVQRRADWVADPATRRLVPANRSPANRARRLAAFEVGVVLAAMAACLLSLSNYPEGVLSKAALNRLVEVPAQLVECGVHRSGYKSPYRIRCAFEYSFDGRRFRGTAESIDFRWFPTDARMNAEVAELQRPSSTTAYVDPLHPGYAWAFISTAWWVPYSSGLLEIELWLALLIGGPFLIVLSTRKLGSLRETNLLTP